MATFLPVSSHKPKMINFVSKMLGKLTLINGSESTFPHSLAKSESSADDSLHINNYYKLNFQ